MKPSTSLKRFSATEWKLPLVAGVAVAVSVARA